MFYCMQVSSEEVVLCQQASGIAMYFKAVYHLVFSTTSFSCLYICPKETCKQNLCRIVLVQEKNVDFYVT